MDKEKYNKYKREQYKKPEVKEKQKKRCSVWYNNNKKEHIERCNKQNKERRANLTNEQKLKEKEYYRNRYQRLIKVI